MTKSRHSRNHISHLITDSGTQVSDLHQIRVMAPKYFQNLFNQNNYWTIFPRLVVKRKLTKEAASWMYRPVSDEEIKHAIFQCHPLKAPGPDGYNAAFFHSNWELVGEEVTQAVKSFFISGKLIRELNHTFLTLVSKGTNASQLL